MHTVIQRPLTENDRRKLLGCLPPTVPPVGDWRRRLKLNLIAQAAGFGIAAVILLWVKHEPAAFVIPALAVCLAIYWGLKVNGLVLAPLRREQEAREQVEEGVRKFEKALRSANEVRITQVEAAGVIEVAHDEGTICLFDLGDGRTYWLDPYIDMLPGAPTAGMWPNGKFEIWEIAGRKEQFGPFYFGKKLRPRKRLEFDEAFSGIDFDKLPADGLINQPLELFLRQAQAGARSAKG